MPPESEWILVDGDANTARRLADELGCTGPLAGVLAARGYTEPRTARGVLDPSPSDIHHPSSLPDIAPAVDRLEAALANDETIALYTDRDVDGISGAAVLATLLEDLGAPVTYRVPGKWDGYGLHADHVEELARNGTDLLVTVDCGTTAHEEIAQARSADIDIVVTDHHRPERDLPEAQACVNPRREDSAYPHEDLAGGAVAFKLGQALVESHAPHRLEGYHRFGLPLAAVATVGDYMTLNPENRALVRAGYDRLFDCGLPGLTETAEHVGLGSVRDLGWSLVPLLNAAQEDESGELMLDLLLATDADHIAATIDTLEDYRAKRRQDRAERLDHLRDCVDDQVDPETTDPLVVETDEYVGGSAMTQVSAEWGRPVVTYRPKNGHYQGGGRSDPAVDFLALFEACDELLDDLWGHPGAAGFRVSEANLEPFLDRLTEEFRARYDPADLRPTVEIECRLSPEALSASLVDELERMGPFGNGNPEPVFLLEDLDLVGLERFGDGNEHCRLEPAGHDGFGILCWDGAEAFEQCPMPGTYDLAGTVRYDDYEGRPAFTVEDFRARTGDSSLVG